MIETPWKILRDEIRSELTEDLTRGNHFALVAPTGQGKTTLATKGLLPMFTGVADVLLIDSTADPKLRNYGKPLNRFGRIDGLRRLTVGDHSPESAAKIAKALQRAYKQGQVVILFDEVRHVTDKKYLNLGALAEHHWLFSRKRENIVGGLTQAPRFVPSAYYDQSKLHFIFKIRDRRAMQRLAEIGGDYDTIREIAPTLGPYEFAFVNSAGDVTTSKFDLPKRSGEKRVEVRREPLPPSGGSRRVVVVPTKGG